MSPEAQAEPIAQAGAPPAPGGRSGAAGHQGEPGIARVAGFSVALPQFEGPFDLLLALIARKRLNVTELALAEVTDDFIAHMRRDWDLGRASEFLVVASTLLALKAHSLLPREEDEEDPDLELLEARDLLFARLLQYRAYKEAAAALRLRAQGAARSHPRTVALEPHLAALLPRLVATTTPQDLRRMAVAALTRPDAPGVQTVHLHESVPVGEQVRLIAARLREHGALSFAEIIQDAGRRAVVVARFLALLILHRQGGADLEQDEAMGEITVRWCAEQGEAGGMMGPDIDEEFA